MSAPTLFDLPREPKESRHPTGAAWNDDPSLRCGDCDHHSMRWDEANWVAVCGRIQAQCIACDAVEWQGNETHAKEAMDIMTGQWMYECPGHDKQGGDPVRWRLVEKRRACEHWRSREAEDVMRALAGVKPWEARENVGGES
jgi:hypothetical protein